MKPKNPYYDWIKTHEDTCIHDAFDAAWEMGYAAGLADGEKRLARALRKYLKANHPEAKWKLINSLIIIEFLKSRSRREK